MFRCFVHSRSTFCRVEYGIEEVVLRDTSSRFMTSASSVMPVASARWRSRDIATLLSCSTAKAKRRFDCGGFGGWGTGTSGTSGTTLSSLGTRRLIRACEQRTFSVATVQPSRAQLSKVAMSRLRQRADATGMTEDALVTNLLEVIAQDDLFDAVLDTAKGAA
jgi:hypothetical protein